MEKGRSFSTLAFIKHILVVHDYPNEPAWRGSQGVEAVASALAGLAESYRLVSLPMGLLEGRRGLIVGIANERSIACGIAKACAAQGASLAITYQSERLAKRVLPIAEELGAEVVVPCDLTDDEQVAALVAKVESAWGKLDFVVHAVAFANREDLEGRFIDTSLDGFRAAMDVSVYTLVSLTRACEGLLRASESGGSVLTLSYYGSEKAIPNYNVMGVAKAALEAAVRYLAVDLGPVGLRVNAISAGAIKTLSAAGIKGMRGMLAKSAEVSPMKRAVTIDDIGRSALYVLSDLSSGMTGEVIHVDAGYHAIGAFEA